MLGDGVDLVIKPTAAALDQMGDFVRSMHGAPACSPRWTAG